jgi:hypothetical protein
MGVVGEWRSGTFPGSIYTPEEYEAFVQKLVENSRSRSRLARYFARMQLARLASHKDARSPNEGRS